MIESYRKDSFQNNIFFNKIILKPWSMMNCRWCWLRIISLLAKNKAYILWYFDYCILMEFLANRRLFKSAKSIKSFYILIQTADKISWKNAQDTHMQILYRMNHTQIWMGQENDPLVGKICPRQAMVICRTRRTLSADTLRRTHFGGYSKMKKKTVLLIL